MPIKVSKLSRRNIIQPDVVEIVKEPDIEPEIILPKENKAKQFYYAIIGGF